MTGSPSPPRSARRWPPARTSSSTRPAAPPRAARRPPATPPRWPATTRSARPRCARPAPWSASDFNEFADLLRLAVSLRGKQVRGNRLMAMSNAGYESVGMADSIRSDHAELTLARLGARDPGGPRRDPRRVQARPAGRRQEPARRHPDGERRRLCADGRPDPGRPGRRRHGRRHRAADPGHADPATRRGPPRVDPLRRLDRPAAAGGGRRQRHAAGRGGGLGDLVRSRSPTSSRPPGCRSSAPPTVRFAFSAPMSMQNESPLERFRRFRFPAAESNRLVEEARPAFRVSVAGNRNRAVAKRRAHR